MYPILGEMDIWGKHIKIESYAVLLSVAMLTIVIGTIWLAGQYKLPMIRVIAVLVPSFLFGLLGARAVFMIFSVPLRPTEAIELFAFKLTGFSIAGAFIIGFPMAIFFSKLFRIDFLRLSDCAAPFVGVGIGISKVGCFLSGCCFGTLTDCFLGVKYPKLSQVHIYQSVEGIIPFIISGTRAVHPVQLYEALVAAVLGGLCFYLLKRRDKDGLLAGEITGIFVVLYSISRLALGCFRETSYFERGYMPDQAYVFIPILVVGVFLAMRNYTKNN